MWANRVHDINELHKITHISKSTLYTYIWKLENFGTIKLKPHSERPKLLSSKKWAHFRKLASIRKCTISKEIAFTLNQIYPNLNITSKTIRENLFNLDYCICISTSISMLTIAAKECKVEWSKSHLDEN